MIRLRSLLFSVGYSFLAIVTSLFLLAIFWALPNRARYFIYAGWCKLAVEWARITCGVHYEVVGRENIPDYPVVILSNHQSTWETIFLYHLFAPAVPVLKKELLKIPLWGWALSLQKPIAIDRSKPREASRSMVDQGSERLKSGLSIFVFPEGTRSKPGKVGRFSRGGAQLATATGTPVLPLLHNAGACWPKGSWVKRPGTIRLVIGKVIESEGRTSKQLAAEYDAWVDQHLSHLDLERSESDHQALHQFDKE